MSRAMPRRWLALTATTLALGPTSCARSTGQLPSEAGHDPLELVLPQEIATLDPRFATRGLDVKLTRLSHTGLARVHADTLEPIPALAARWSAESPTRLRVVLRRDARFHSGRPLTPADVCATLRAVADPRLASPHRAVARDIARCTELGAHDLELEWSKPRASRLSDLELPILRADQAAAPPDPSGALDGIGPFRVVGRVGTGLHLAASDDGFDSKPRHDLVVRSVRDENARAQRALSGAADVLPNAFTPALLDTLTAHGKLTVRSRAGANTTYLALHNERAPLDRVELRHAIAQAIDRAAIARTLFAGRAEVARSLLPPGHWATPTDAELPLTDAHAARARLTGQRPLELLVSTERLRIVVARAIAQQLGDAGLTVRVVPLDLGVLLQRLDRGDFELAVLQFPELTEPNLLSWFFHARGVPGEGGEGRNRVRYRDERVAAWLDAASGTEDRGERRELYGRVIHELHRALPVVPLWHEAQLAVVSPRAAGFLPSAEGRWLALAELP